MLFQVRFWYEDLNTNESRIRTAICGAADHEHLVLMLRKMAIESGWAVKPLEIRQLFDEGFVAATDGMLFRDNH